VPIRRTRKITHGAAMVTLSEVLARLRLLSQDGSLTRWERVCYQTSIALMEKAVDDLRR